MSTFFLLGQNDIFANVGLLVSCSVCRPSNIHSISFEPLICVIVAKLGRVDARRDQVSPSISRPHGQRSRSNCWSLKKCSPLIIIWPLCLKVAKLGTVDARREQMTPIDFRSYCQKSRSNYGSLKICCPLNIS